MSENPEAGIPEGEGGTPPAQQQKAGRGCGLFTWIVILAIGLIVAVLIVHKAQVEQQKKLAAEKASRHSVRVTQMGQIGDNVAKAVEYIRQGDLSRGIEILEAQSATLSALATEASSNGDSEDATDAVNKKAVVGSVLTAIKQKQEELKTFAEEQAASLAAQFPQVKAAPQAPPAEAAPEAPAPAGQPVPPTGAPAAAPPPAAPGAPPAYPPAAPATPPAAPGP